MAAFIARFGTGFVIGAAVCLAGMVVGLFGLLLSVPMPRSESLMARSSDGRSGLGTIIGASSGDLDAKLS